MFCTWIKIILASNNFFIFTEVLSSSIYLMKKLSNNFKTTCKTLFYVLYLIISHIDQDQPQFRKRAIVGLCFSVLIASDLVLSLCNILRYFVMSNLDLKMKWPPYDSSFLVPLANINFLVSVLRILPNTYWLFLIQLIAVVKTSRKI